MTDSLRYPPAGTSRLNSPEFNQLLLDVIDALVIVLDRGGRIVLFNPACEKLTGWRCAEVLGTRLVDRLVPEDQRAGVSEVIDRIAAGRFPAHYENDWLTRSGERRWIAWANSALLNEAGDVEFVVGTGLNISDRLAAERKLRLSEERFRSLLESGMDGIVTVDQEWRMLTMSPSVRPLLGYDEPELSGRCLLELVDPTDARELRNILTTAAADPGRPVPGMARVQRKSGEWRIMEGVTTDLRHVDAVQAFVVNFRDVTPRKNAENALQASEGKYRRLHDTMRDAFVQVNLAGRIVDFNTAYEALLGYTADEILRLHYTDITPERWHAAEARIIEEQVLARGYSDIYVKEYRRKDGTEFPIELRTVLLLDEEGRPSAMWAIVRDISERLQAEKALRDSEQKYRLIVETAQEGVWVIDSESRTTFVNQRMAAMLGYGVDEMLGESLFHFMDDEGRQLAAWNVERRQQGIREQVDFKFRHKNGSDVWTMIDTNPMIGPTGDYLGALAMITDITERRRLDEERRRLEQQLQQSQRLESLGMLAGGIAHDFNNILMAIVGNLDLSLSSLSRLSPARQNIESAVASAMRAAELCKQMLAFAGRGRLSMEVIDPNAIIADLMHMLAISVSRKVELRTALASGVPAVLGDPTQLRQVIMNLVINASEAIGDTSGTVTISTGERSCRQEDLRAPWFKGTPAAGNYVFVEVSDTGCGMPPEIMARIFDPFFTTKFTGRGLGLAGVLGIVRAHKGTIHVESEMDRGTTFRVYLPVAPPSPDKRVDHSADTVAEHRPRGRKEPA